MKILQINNFHYVRGGSDRVYLDTIELLSKAGHEVYSFSSLDDNNVQSPFSHYYVKKLDLREIQGWKDKILSAVSFVYNYDAVKNLAKLLSDFRPDIVHLHIFQSRLSSAIIKVLNDFHIPIVMTVHEYKMLCPVYTFLDKEGEICEKCAKNQNYTHAVLNKCVDNNLFKSVLSATESFVRDTFFSYVDGINHFIMVSQFIHAKHIQYNKKFSEKSSVLYNFIDIEKFVVSEPKKGEYMLYFGRLSKEKGVKTLIQAFEKKANIRLKIVGDGILKPDLENYISSNNIQNVDFLGFKQSDEIRDIISNASYIIVPSEWYENNPMTVIEAMAMGKPVIGASIGGIPELVKHSENGFLFESRNVVELAELIDSATRLDEQSYSSLCLQARTFAEQNFSSIKYISKLEQLYAKVISGKENK